MSILTKLTSIVNLAFESEMDGWGGEFGITSDGDAQIIGHCVCLTIQLIDRGNTINDRWLRHVWW
jgi:hypothetical protein